MFKFEICKVKSKIGVAEQNLLIVYIAESGKVSCS